jgi:protein disulfide-isomerase
MHWLPLSDAWAESQRTGKPLLIDFNADWCGPCQRLKQTVFDNPGYAGAIDAAVIPVSIVDRQREDGSNPPETENLQHRFGVRAFPTLVIISPATGKVVRTEGAGEPDATRNWIVQGAAAVK